MDKRLEPGFGFAVPNAETPVKAVLPNGLSVLPDFITPDYEDELLKFLKERESDFSK